jgi:hypothetical protein
LDEPGFGDGPPDIPDILNSPFIIKLNLILCCLTLKAFEFIKLF